MPSPRSERTTPLRQAQAQAPAPGPLRVLVTRPQPQADDGVAALRAAGIDAQALPLLAIEPESGDAVARAWRSLDDLALVMFVSPNAVARFFAARPAGATWPPGLVAAAPGPGSEAALALAGVARRVAPAADAAQFDSEALWPRLRELRADWRGARVLIVRGDGGRDALAQWLRDAGAEVGFVQAYRRVAPVWSAGEHALHDAARREPQRHLWLLSSAQALSHLPPVPEGRAGWRALATHPRIVERALALGFGRVDPVRPGIDAVLGALGLAAGSHDAGAPGPADDAGTAAA